MKGIIPIMLALTFSVTPINSPVIFANDNIQESTNEYNYSVQEIVNKINNEYHIGLELTQSKQKGQTPKKLTKTEFERILRTRAEEIVVNNEKAKMLFEESTGVSPDTLPKERLVKAIWNPIMNKRNKILLPLLYKQ